MSNITESLKNFWNGAVKPIAQKMAADRTQVSATLPATGWTNGSGVTNYPYYRDLSVSGVTANDIANVTVAGASQTAAVACGLAPLCETRAGAIRFFAAAAPGSAIGISYLIQKAKREERINMAFGGVNTPGILSATPTRPGLMLPEDKAKLDGIVPATPTADGLMSAQDKTKLDGIASGAQVNVLEGVKLNGQALTPSNKAVNLPLATENAAGLMSAADKEELGMLEKFTQGGVPYGKKLTESWQSLRTRIVAGDFSGIHIGDFKTITLTTGEVVICEVAGIDQYYRCGDTEIGHHIDFISRDCLAGAKRMNATNMNNGTEAEKHPWLASELYQTLNDETSGVYATLPTDLKPYIITKQALMEERYSSGGAVTVDTGWSWANMGKLWLPTEVEVFGHPIWSEPGFGTGGVGCNLQYPIFMSGSLHIIKGDGNGGFRCGWWEVSAIRMDATNFCHVTYYGAAGSDAASNTSRRAPLCFRIG